MNILELCARNDGYLTREDSEIIELRRAGLVTTTEVVGGYLIARAVRPEPAKYLYRRDSRFVRAAEIGGAL